MSKENTAQIKYLHDVNVSHSADGIHVVVMDSFEEFAHLLEEGHFRDRPQYVFRGHRDPSWQLTPTLYRKFDDFSFSLSTSTDDLDRRRDAGRRIAGILRDFTYAIRGTQYLRTGHDRLIGLFQSRPNLHILEIFDEAKSDSELRAVLFDTWALGQHHELLTPLLDWSESPLMALYFAFEKEEERTPTPEHRVVYALNRKLISEICSYPDFLNPKIAFVSPLTRYNFRLLHQKGLFTYSFDYRSMEAWIAEIFKGQLSPVLIRILIKNAGREDCLRWLNRMGVNAQAVFPDLIGISQHCNQRFIDQKLGWEIP